MAAPRKPESQRLARCPAAGDWFLDNTRSFRRTLLMRRDGARLHAGSTPANDLDRIRRKMDFLVTSGVPERDAQMAMLAVGRFTVGSVLEEQADVGSGRWHAQLINAPPTGSARGPPRPGRPPVRPRGKWSGSA
ncbi:TetR/AcrR family transcriptional regulator C-terminal domain-containing protein [Streptomyces tauricus]